MKGGDIEIDDTDDYTSTPTIVLVVRCPFLVIGHRSHSEPFIDHSSLCCC